MKQIIKYMLKVRRTVVSPVLAFLERVRHPHLYKKGKTLFADMRKKCFCIDTYIKYITEDIYSWESDPVYGIIDFTSYPEITAAKRKGDCDDLACLAVEVLKSKYKKAWYLFTFDRVFGGHAMALFFDGEKYQLISNTQCIYEAFDEENIFERAARAYNGAGLWFYTIQKVK